MPCDVHITLFNRERGGENRHAISTDVWKGLVLDHVTLEQDTYRRVAAEDERSVESEESGCHMLI
jgi:hypothetical protein